MFGVLPPGVRIGESYSDFTESTLLTPAPIPCWPATLGHLAAKVIHKENAKEDKATVLVANGGAGRIGLELLRHCSNLDIDHADPSPDHYNVLSSLLDNSRLEWDQPLEGRIVERREYGLENEEKKQGLLQEKGNRISFTQATIDCVSANGKQYDFIVADLRWKDAAEDIRTLAGYLVDGGVLVLGSVDDIDEDSPSRSNCGSVLSSLFCRIPQTSHDACYPHIYRETRNKHQFTISHLSVWRKNASGPGTGSDVTSTKSDNQAKDAVEYYESSGILNSYDIFHFGEGLLSVKNFPLRMSEVCIEACKMYGTNLDSALDAGSGPGRTAMELCKVFNQVYAYDYSEGFVENMLEKAAAAGLTNLDGRQGDSHAQDAMYPGQKFDLIFGCNLIDRLHTPKLWIQQSKAMLSDRGLLIISSPYTWKPEHTSVEEWIGGFSKDGVQKFTQEGLQELLSPELKLLKVTKVPFVIPDSDGTFQYTYSNCTVFGRH